METTTADTKKGNKNRSPRVRYNPITNMLAMRTGGESINGRDGPVIPDT